MPLAFTVRCHSFKASAPDVTINVNQRHSWSSSMPTHRQCLICLKKTDSSGQFISVEERQLSVIYLLNKLLQIPSEVCANYLANFGNPEEWITICADCSSLVGEGRRLFNKIRQLKRRHKQIGVEIRMKMKVKTESEDIDDGQAILGQSTAEIRNYLDILDNLSAVSMTTDIDAYNDELEHDNNDPVEVTKTKKSRKRKVNKTLPRSKLAVKDNRNFIKEDIKMEKGQQNEDEECAMDITYDKNEKEEVVDAELTQGNEVDPLAFDTIDKDCSDNDGFGAPKIKTKRRRQRKVKKSAANVNKAMDPSSSGGVKCLECEARFKNNGILESHMRREHFDKDGLKCRGCLTVYNKINTYKIHYAKKLATEPSSSCATAGIICDKGDCKRFNVLRCSPQALDLHSKIFHTFNPTTDQIFACDICNEHFPSKRDLIFHRSAHKRHDRLVCPRPGCSKTFETPQRLKNHLDGIHAKLDGAAATFLCEKCPRSFHTEKNLGRHIQVQHGNGEPCICELCGKAFKVRHYLVQHMWSHDPVLRKKKYERDKELKALRKQKQLLMEQQSSNHGETEKESQLVIK